MNSNIQNMKNLKQILVAILVLTSIISCEKDENEPNDILKMETISAKWIVDGTSDYVSFEFNESGNYIVVENTTTKSTNEQIVLFGTYEIIDDKTIVLSDFGTINISEIQENTISFSILLNSDPNNEIVIHASKQEEMENTTKTELLCRTWEMVTIDGEDVAGTDMELTVLFSAAGTYFVSYAIAEDGSAGGLAQWKWKNEIETQLLYSWAEVPVWDEASYVEILELTSNKLKIIEYEETYVLQPVSNNKSANINVSKSLPNMTMKTGFFKE
jgi:hypothetical protein